VLTVVSLTLRALLVGVLVWSAASKLTASGFRSVSAMFGQLGTGRHARLASTALVAAEAGTAGLLATPWTVSIGLVAAIALFAALTVGTVVVVRRRLGVRCACFGRSAAPVSASHVVRNVILLLGAVGAAWSTWSIVGQVVTTADLAVSVGAGAVLAVLVGRWDDLAFLFAEPTRH
jgi:hypothetical protein